MSYTRLIHDYLDGEIAGSTQEEVLFNVLASDEELRSEFKRQVRIHTIAQKDMATILPPAALTNQIFTGLGFAAPGVQIASNVVNNNFFNLMKKYSASILLILLTFSFAGAGYFYFENMNLKQNFASNSIQNSNQIPAKSNYPITNSFESNVPFIGSDYAQNNEQIAANQNIIVTNQNKSLSGGKSANKATERNIIAVSNNQNSNLAIGNVPEIFASTIFTDLHQFFSNFSSSSTNNFDNFELNSFSDNFNPTDFYYDNSKWQLIFRRISPFSYDADNISAQLDNPLSNFSLTVFRKINHYHSIGLEIGSEQFSQIFPSSNEKISYTQMQNPMLIWAGATYRFTPIDYIIPYKLYPYAQLSASGTTIGPIIRGQIGMNWQLANNFNIVLGYDYGALFYNVSGNIYNSPKSGLIFGAGVKF